MVFQRVRNFYHFKFSRREPNFYHFKLPRNPQLLLEGHLLKKISLARFGARFGAADWRGTPSWARHTDVAFDDICEVVAARIERTRA